MLSRKKAKNQNPYLVGLVSLLKSCASGRPDSEIFAISHCLANPTRPRHSRDLRLPGPSNANAKIMEIRHLAPGIQNLTARKKKASFHFWFAGFCLAGLGLAGDLALKIYSS